MAGLTLADAQAQLALWLAASAAVATGQEYEINTGNGSRRLKRADASEIRLQIDNWQAKIATMTPLSAGGRRRMYYVVPE
jgi:hypothetical protein